MSSNVRSTPFANWRERGGDDPHGALYRGGLQGLAHPGVPCELLATRLATAAWDIGVLTAGKDRLRWMSRRLFAAAPDPTVYNERRAALAMGELTDDELANAFYLSECAADMAAGSERLRWLARELDALGVEYV